MTIPIDMDRWEKAFEQLSAVVLKVSRKPEWDWIRTHYAGALAVYSMMTAEQQSTVKDQLEALRVKLEQLSHLDEPTAI